MIKRLSIIVCIILTSCFKNGYCQNVNSLFDESIDGVEIYFDGLSQQEKVKYSKEYLSKAKLNKVEDKIIYGYYLHSLAFSHSELALRYTDSIINSAIENNNTALLAKGYMQKGIQLYYQSRNEEAFESFLKAKEYLKNAANNEYSNVVLNHYIGLLKNNLNQERQALQIFKKNIIFFNKETLNQKKHSSQYLKSLYALADSYYRNELIDSSGVINEIGINKSLTLKDSVIYPDFLISYSENKILKEDYQSAIDSLKKSILFIKNKNKSLTDAFYILSKAYEGIGNRKLSKKYLKKIDSIYLENPEVIYNAKKANDKLYEYSKLEKSYEEQLGAINKILSIDSVLQFENREFNFNKVDKSDVTRLVSEKEKLISTLENKNAANKVTILLLVVTLIALGLILFLYIKRNIIYKKRFNKLIKLKDDRKDGKEPTGVNHKILVSNSVTGVPEKLVEEILIKLEEFESQNMFIKNYTLSSLAKELKTNSSYLSKIINETKRSNFSNYLNKLRVNYAIERLKHDKAFSLYSIDAIAKEAGFNTAQSFTKAFYKRTGINPSYFIKNIDILNKDKENLM